MTPAQLVRRAADYLERHGVDSPRITAELLLAGVLQVDRSTLHRLLSRDRLRSDAADRIAVTLGRHPSELWPEWFADASGAP